jgi:hypothetical protein
MKLIRLTTEDDKAFFQSKFNTDIVVEPDSQVALQNFSAEIELPTIVVGPGQRTVSIILVPDTAEGFVDAIMQSKDAPYGPSNWGDFMQDLERALNYATGVKDYATVTDNSTLLAIEFACDTTEALRTNIQYRYSIYNYHPTLLSHPGTLVNNPNPGEYVGTKTSSLYDQAVLGQLPLCRGQSIWRAQLGTLANAGGAPVGLGEQGFLLGVSTSNLDNVNPRNFAPTGAVGSTILFGIGVSFVNGDMKYYIQTGDTLTQQAATPVYVGNDSNQNDFIEIQKSGDELLAIRYRHGQANQDIIDRFPLLRSDALTFYPFCAFHSAVSVRNLSWTPSPFTDAVLGNTVLAVPAGFPTSLVSPQRRTVMRPEIQFESKAMGEWLGYKLGQLNDTLDFTSTLLEGSVVSENLFEARAQTPHLMVELMSNPLESFDSQPGVRKSLLSTMIRYQPDGKIQSEPPRTFIDLANAQRINLKNVQLRLVNNNYEPVAVRGRSIATLLIKSRSE